jgi:hypothetical protein
MEPIRNPNKKKERQTAIIDDAEALAMLEVQSQQGRRGGGKKAGGKSKPGFSFSKAQNAGVSKPNSKTAPHDTGVPKNNQTPKKGHALKPKTAFTHSTHPVAQFYEEDGLRIPLFDMRGKRKMHAKDGNAMAIRHPRSYLLDIVKEYAGEDKKQKFEAENLSKKEIGAWIEAVETKAYGSAPVKVNGATPERKKVAAVASAPNPPKSQTGTGEQRPLATSETEQTRSGMPNMASGQSKRKRHDDVLATQGQQTKTTKTQTSQVTTKPAQAPRLQDRTRAQQNPQTQPEPAEQNLEEAILQAFVDDSEDEMAPVRRQQKPSANPQSKKFGNSPSRRANAPNHNRTSTPVPEVFRVTIPAKKPSVNDKDMDLYIPKMDDLPKGQQHPLISALDLTPKAAMLPDTSTRVLNLPRQRVHAIVTAESETAVHVTEIPYKDTKNHAVSVPRAQQSPIVQPEEAAPYLKAGPHGYDDVNHRWHYPSSDPSLVTGIGHQVEPADSSAWESIVLRVGEQTKLIKSTHGKTVAVEKEKLKKLEREKTLFMKGYREKYPGTTAAQWPCGCERVGNGAWEEGDSEEE